MFDTPVLLIIFNRPDATLRVFEQIRKIKPRYLFVAADGPRSDKSEDTAKCAETRMITTHIDWECELRTLFRSENRGCGHGPAEAITWFFEHVEQGIILEDDCLPDPTFFSYCAELLKKFESDEKIWIISGTNPLKIWYPQKASYIFSMMGGTWGWATWRRAWKHFDYSASQWLTKEGKDSVKQTLANEDFFTHLSREFDTYFATQRDDVWDFQWYFCRLYYGGCSIVPTLNLISNIGYGVDATHTFDPDAPTFKVPVFELPFPLKHSRYRIDHFYDRLVFERFINPAPRSLLKKIILKTVKLCTRTN